MDDLFVTLLISAVSLLLLLRWSVRMLIGREAMNQMVGILAADVMRFLFLAPFRLLRWIARRLGLIP